MRKRIVSIVLCLCIFSGAVTGCGMKAGEETSVSQAEGNFSETDNVYEEDSSGSGSVWNNASGKDSSSPGSVNGSASEASDTASEDSGEEVNALGLPLMDGTALLVTVTKYRYSDNYKRIVRQYEYDCEGRILRYIGGRLIPDDLDYSNIEFEYDVDGSLFRQTCYDMRWREKSWELSYWVEYSYEEDTDRGISRTERKHAADGSLSRESFYDSEGNLLRQITYEGNRMLSEYEYDPLEYQSWRTRYDDHGDILERCREVYDDAGNQTLYVRYDGEGNIDVFEGYECDRYVVIYPYRSYENTYNDHGNLIRQVQYGYENNVEVIREYTYDAKGNLVKEFFSDDMVTSEGEYEYDDAGNQIKELYTEYWYDDAGKLQTYGSSVLWEREYDQENRRIRYIDYDWNRPECWYEYTYKTIGISEENYPYDKMDGREYYYYY